MAKNGSHPAITHQAFSASGPRSLSILNPVDLTTGLPDPDAGELLRATLAKNPQWKVLPGDDADRTLREYGLDPHLPCTEFQCAYDAGNALQNEFILFGTTTSLPEMHAYTLDLVHVPSSQVVWSRVGQAPKRSGGHNRKGYILEGTLQFAVSDLDPGALDLQKRPTLGLLGVMDAGQSTPHSRVALHRALTHAYASRAYDLLGPAELDELLAALDIPKRASGSLADGTGPKDGTGNASGSGIGGSRSAPDGSADMLAIGTKMGVRYLLWSRVKNQGREYKTELTLYDVAGRKLVRHWPSKKSSDFASLLSMEDRFLTALGDQAPSSQVPGPPRRSKVKLFGKIASISLATAASAAMGYMAYQYKQDADKEYRRFQVARSEQEASLARQSVLKHDTQAKQYGALGGLSLALGVAVWVF